MFNEMVLMEGHNVCFCWKMRKIIFEVSVILPLIRSSGGTDPL